VQREIRRHTTYTSIRHIEEYIYRDLADISIAGFYVYIFNIDEK